MGLTRWLGQHMTGILTKERPVTGTPLCDFDKIRFEVRSADVLLFEGRSRISEVIKIVTQSPWTHSALYIGKLSDIDDHQTRLAIRQQYHGDPNEQLLIEALIGEGIVVVPMSKYCDDHVRICRPRGLARRDAQEVIGHVAARLGQDYDVRQILDLARFLFPWAVLPRRWRSSLFEHNVGDPTRTVCSTLLVDAYSHVNFPVLPVVEADQNGALKLYRRNPRLFSPRDFDYSPYFDIIKYPFVAFEHGALYRQLPWERGVVCNAEGDCTIVREPDDETNAAAPTGRSCA